MSEPKYDIEIQLSGTDGNAFMVIGRMSQELKKAGAPAGEIREFQTEAMSGNYNDLLRTCAKWAHIS